MRIRREADSIPQYKEEDESRLFTMKCFHGGTFFERMRNVFYSHGEVHYIDEIDADYFSKFEIDCIAESLGLSQPLGYVYRRPKLSLVDGLMRLMSDKDVLGMLEDLSFSRIIEVYFIPPPVPRLSITFEKNVEITEVDDIDAEKHHLGTLIEPIVEEVDEGCDENIVEVETDSVDIAESQPLSGSQPPVISQDDIGGNSDFAEEVRQWEEILTNNEDYGIQFEDLFDWNVRFDDHSNEQHEVRQHGDERNDKGDVPDEEHDEEPEEEHEVPDDEHNEVPDEEHTTNPDEQHEEEFNDSDYEQEVPILNDDANFETHYTWDDDRPIVHEGSEDDDSDELRSLDSDEEGCGKRKEPDIVYSGRADNEDPQFQIGLQFETKAQLKNLIKQYSVKHGRAIRFVKDDRIRLRAKCVEGCPWTLYARVVQRTTTFRINTLDTNHNCAMVFENKHATSTFFSTKYVDMFRREPNLTFNSFEEIVKKDCTVNASRSQFYRTRTKCLEAIRGSNNEQYKILSDYMEELRKSNVGSTVVLKTEMVGDVREFRRVYICLGALKEGFRAGCRRVIGLDGCFLKGENGGHMLTAVGIDADNGMYPLAYAVVESENSSSWKWFVEILVDDAGVGNSYGWTFISDKQKGLVDALESCCENAEHRFCVRHLYANFRIKFSGLALKRMLWAAARSTTEVQWKVELERMKQQNVDAYNWLADKPATQWSRSHFRETNKCDIMMNNLCESFNAAIVQARDKPIICLLEKIRYYLMTRLATRRENVTKWVHPFGPKVWKILEKTKVESRYCQPTYAGDRQFEVRDNSTGFMYAVDLRKMTCTCRRIQLLGLPCAHAISSITYCKLRIEDYVDMCYSKESFVRAYHPVICPTAGPEFWADSKQNPINPPPHRKQPGRPKKVRRREVDEAPSTSNKRRRFGIRMSCKKCGQTGHNKRGCKIATTGSTGAKQATKKKNKA